MRGEEGEEVGRRKGERRRRKEEREKESRRTQNQLTRKNSRSSRRQEQRRLIDREKRQPTAILSLPLIDRQPGSGTHLLSLSLAKAVCLPLPLPSSVPSVLSLRNLGARDQRRRRQRQTERTTGVEEEGFCPEICSSAAEKWVPKER